MTDPTVEAAKRGVGQHHWWLTRLDDARMVEVVEYATDSARQALKPIRELHQPLELKQSVFNGEGIFIGQRVSAVVCGHCYGGPRESGHCDDCDSTVCEGTFGPHLGFTWPCATARLIYSTEELS